MRRSNRAPGYSWQELAGPLGLLAVLAGLGALIAAAWCAATAAASPEWHVPQPVAPMVTALLRHGLAAVIGPTGSVPVFWLVFVGVLAVPVAASAVTVVMVRRRTGHRAADQVGRYLGGPRDLSGITPADAATTAVRLLPGVHPRKADEHGLLLGELDGGMQIRMGWEDVAIGIAGPRTGKTTTISIPWMLTAPGAVLATSNKPDLHDATRGVREQLGTVWNFDPQRITLASSAPEWWWQPLDQVDSYAAARKLASYFVAATTDPTSRADAYFDPEGQELLTAYLLAAALGGGDVVHTAEWLADDRDETPRSLLAHHGFDVLAQQVAAVQLLAPKQKDGLYGTARKFVAVLKEPRYAAWVTPNSRRRFRVDGNRIWFDHHPTWRHRVPKFDPASFVTARDTLYAHSVEGPDSAAALTTALVGQVFEAGRLVAETLPGRRLTPPLLSVLDEAANVVRIAELPNLYSHFGSRGMPVLTLLQSWSQGCRAWGEPGMRTLWSAANVKWYGGGVSDPGFLRELSDLIGEHDVQRWSTHLAHSGTSRSQSWTREPIMSISDLTELPKGRALLISSGNPATLLHLRPWMDSPHAPKIRASLQKYEPTDRAEERESSTARIRHDILTAHATPRTLDGTL